MKLILEVEIAWRRVCTYKVKKEMWQYLFIECELQLQLSRREHEVLAHDGAGLRPGLGRRVLHLADTERHRTPTHTHNTNTQPLALSLHI